MELADNTSNHYSSFLAVGLEVSMLNRLISDLIVQQLRPYELPLGLSVQVQLLQPVRIDAVGHRLLIAPSFQVQLLYRRKRVVAQASLQFPLRFLLTSKERGLLHIIPELEKWRWIKKPFLIVFGYHISVYAVVHLFSDYLHRKVRGKLLKLFQEVRPQFEVHIKRQLNKVRRHFPIMEGTQEIYLFPNLQAFGCQNPLLQTGKLFLPLFAQVQLQVLSEEKEEKVVALDGLFYEGVVNENGFPSLQVPIEISYELISKQVAASVKGMLAGITANLFQFKGIKIRGEGKCVVAEIAVGKPEMIIELIGVPVFDYVTQVFSLSEISIKVKETGKIVGLVAGLVKKKVAEKLRSLAVVSLTNYMNQLDEMVSAKLEEIALPEAMELTSEFEDWKVSKFSVAPNFLFVQISASGYLHVIEAKS